jgi:hypothetical protein
MSRCDCALVEQKLAVPSPQLDNDLEVSCVLQRAASHDRRLTFDAVQLRVQNYFISDLPRSVGVRRFNVVPNNLNLILKSVPLKPSAMLHMLCWNSHTLAAILIRDSNDGDLDGETGSGAVELRCKKLFFNFHQPVICFMVLTPMLFLYGTWQRQCVHEWFSEDADVARLLRTDQFFVREASGSQGGECDDGGLLICCASKTSVNFYQITQCNNL